MANRATITAALKREGYPVDLYRGVGYYYFVWDDLDAGGTWHDVSVAVCNFRDLTPDQWLEEGRTFAEAVKKLHPKNETVLQCRHTQSTGVN